MTHQDFIPSTRQQNLIDAAQSITAPGQTVAEIIRETNNLLHAVNLLFMNEEYAHDTAKNLVHIVSNNMATVGFLIDGLDVSDMLIPIDQN